MQNDPSKHHYIPAFYLREWATNGYLIEMRKVYGKVVSRPKPPDATGFMKDLYKIDGVPKEVSQHLENTFMRMVDNEACDVMRMIPDGRHAHWTIRQRDAWVRFLMSLMFRNPEVVGKIKVFIREMWEEGLKTLHADYERHRRANDPDTFEDFLSKTDPHAPAIAASNFLQTIMNSQVIGNGILGLKWGRVWLKNSRFPLMTSDRPLDIPFGLNDPGAYITLPIGPYMVFTACKDDSVLKELREGDHSKVAKKINERVVQQARQYVWCKDEAGYTFVKKHIGTIPDRIYVSERAKKAAMDEARGGQPPVPAKPPFEEPSPR